MSSSSSDGSPKRMNKKARISFDDFEDIVVVKVGTEKRIFKVHKRLLCKSAAYFRAALEGSFAEAESQVLELPEEKVEVIERFVFWLYTDKVLQEDDNFDEDEFDDISWDSLFDLYLFSEARGIAFLQNKVIDVLIDKSNHLKTVPTEFLKYIYENTQANSPIRRLLVDWAAHDGMLTDDWFTEETYTHYPKDFLIDLVCALYNLKTADKARRRDIQASRSDYYMTPSA